MSKEKIMKKVAAQAIVDGVFHARPIKLHKETGYRDDGSLQLHDFTITQTKALPKKMSDLLDTAVDDAMAAEKTKGVTLNMGQWATRHADTCYVCLAGSMMLKRFDLSQQPIDTEVTPDDLPKRLNNAMNALHSLRGGETKAAFKQLRSGAEPTAKQALGLSAASAIIKNAYADNMDRAPWGAYRMAAGVLRSVGL